MVRLDADLILVLSATGSLSGHKNIASAAVLARHAMSFQDRTPHQKNVAVDFSNLRVAEKKSAS